MSEHKEKDTNLDDFKFSLKELISIFLYSYGGNKSKTYDLALSLVASDIIAYRLKGATERPDLFLSLKEKISHYWKWDRHPERWNGDSENKGE